MNTSTKYCLERVYKTQKVVAVFLITLGIVCSTKAQTLPAVTANDSSTINRNDPYTTVTGVTIDVTDINKVLVVASFEISMAASNTGTRRANLRISDSSDPQNTNSGVFIRGLNAARTTDYGIGSIVYIFDVSADSGNKTYNLEHDFTSTGNSTLTTAGAIVAVSLTDDQTPSVDLQSSLKVATNVTVPTSWAAITGTETDPITTTSGGFYVAASIGSGITTYTNLTKVDYKLEYKVGVNGTWQDLTSLVIERNISSTSDEGLISLVGTLPDATPAGDYYFRIAHSKPSGTSTVQTTRANIVAVALGTDNGNYPAFSTEADGITTTSSTLSNAASISITPDVDLDLFIHSQFGMQGSATIGAPTFDLFVNNSIFNGRDHRRYISSDTDRGAAGINGLAENLISGTTYDVSLRHASDGTATLTTNDILLTGFGLNVNSSLLPISLLNFEANKEKDGIGLSWLTVNEINNDFFIVERSVNGRDWEEIQKVKGAGNSYGLLSYTAFDNKPHYGWSYYRLKQTDFDGQYSFSKIISIYFESIKNIPVKIFPNPAIDILTLSANEEELRHVLIFDFLGQNVTDLTRIIKQDRSSLIIDISNLPDRPYLLKTKTTTNILYKQSQ